MSPLKKDKFLKKKAARLTKVGQVETVIHIGMFVISPRLSR